jgi:hypothetical protein
MVFVQHLVCCYGQFDQLLWTCHSIVYQFFNTALAHIYDTVLDPLSQSTLGSHFLMDDVGYFTV